MFNKIRFFLKKLRIKESEYDDLICKANTYDKMISCMKIDINTESTYAHNKNGVKIACFNSSRDCTVNLKVKDLFEAAGFTFDKSVKFNIDMNMD